MKSAPSRLSSWSVAGVYLFGLLLFFWPFADLVTNSLPVRLGNLHWRYGFAGLMAAYLNTPLLALILLMGVAYGLQHARVLRLLSALEILMAAALVMVVVVFALDLGQVRASRPAAVQGSVLAGGVVAILKHLGASAVLTLLGIGGWRTARRISDRTDRDGPQAGVVMNQREARRTPQ